MNSDSIDFHFLQTLLSWCCGEDKQLIKDVSILSHVLLDWRIWHKAPPTVWEKLLRQLDNFLSSGDDVNLRAFADAKAIIKILYTSKVNSQALLRSMSMLKTIHVCVLEQGLLKHMKIMYSISQTHIIYTDLES